MGRPTRPVQQPIVGLRIRLGVLGLGLVLGACRSDGRLTVVNHSDDVVTAVFDREGTDLLDGATLPPGTFARVELPAVDTGTHRLLEAYTASGACARSRPVQEDERWEIASRDLDPGGC